MARTKTRRSQGFSVYPRKDGRWGWAITVDYDPLTGNPKRIQGISTTQKEASNKAVAISAKIKAGAHVPHGKDQTVAAYLDEWLELYVKPHREPKTFGYYEGMVRHHLKPTLGRFPLRKLTVAMVQRLLNEKMKPTTINGKQRTLSPETIRGIRATLRSALSQAHRNGLVAENVAQRVTTPKVRAASPVFLSQEQVKKLLVAAKDHPLLGLITLALHTGLRVGEATGLTWSSVDFKTNSLRIQAQLQRIDGKLVLKSLKTDRANRTLHLTPTAIEVLRSEKAKQLLVLNQGDNPLDLVFLNSESRPLDPKYVDNHLKALMAMAGIPPVSFHKLRHTAATLALASGVPLSVIRDQLGHSQIALTANKYSHAVPNALQEAAESLERLYKPA